MTDITRPPQKDVRTIQMPTLAPDERIEAEIWNSYNSRKRPPMWLLLTNHHLHHQSTRLFGYKVDETVRAIPIASIQEIRFTCLNPFIIRFLGMILLIGGLIIVTLGIARFEIVEEFYGYIRPFVKPAIVAVVAGTIMQLGGHKVRIIVHYLENGRKRRKFKYSSPLMFSSRTADIVYLNSTTLVNWARLHKITLRGESYIMAHWEIKQKPLLSSLPKTTSGFMHSRPGNGSDDPRVAHIPTTGRAIRHYFPCYGSTRILTWLPAIVFAMLALLFAVSLAEVEELAERARRQNLLLLAAGAGVLFVLSVAVPFIIKGRRCWRNSELIREIFRTGMLYPARVTSNHPYIIAVYADLSEVSTGPILKVIRCPELDHVNVSNLPVGTPMAVAAHIKETSKGDPSFEFRPYSTYPITTPYSPEDPVGRIPQEQWDRLDAPLLQIAVPEAPALYYQIANGEWVIWQSIHTTHTIDGR